MASWTHTVHAVSAGSLDLQGKSRFCYHRYEAQGNNSPNKHVTLSQPTKSRWCYLQIWDASIPVLMRVFLRHMWYSIPYQTVIHSTVHMNIVGSGSLVGKMDINPKLNSHVLGRGHTHIYHGLCHGLVHIRHWNPETVGECKRSEPLGCQNIHSTCSNSTMGKTVGTGRAVLTMAVAACSIPTRFSSSFIVTFLVPHCGYENHPHYHYPSISCAYLEFLKSPWGIWKLSYSGNYHKEAYPQSLLCLPKIGTPSVREGTKNYIILLLFGDVWLLII